MVQAYSVSAMRELRILIVDDHPIIRHGLRTLLEAQPGWRICSEAATGKAALQKVKTLLPNIVLLDFCLPDIQGHEVVPRILEIHPQANILALTEHETRETVSQALTSGARGLVFKSDGLPDMIRGVRALANGKSFQSRRAAAFVKDGLGGRVVNLRAALTSRELEIMKLLAEGTTNKQAAARLGVSARTVEAHRASFMRKLDLHSLRDLICFAIRYRMVRI
jgi:DNA-binding NarL/FixJ family response regulator